MRTKYEYTKGNWSIDRESNNELWIISSINEAEPLAKICGADYSNNKKVEQSKESEANAKLITASPELLCQLEKMVSLFDRSLPEGSAGRFACDEAKRIILKATE